MTSLADRTITALRTTHDALAARVAGLSDEQLLQGSGASEWTVAQALSHIGSGGEIGLAGFRSAVAGEPAPDQSFNEGVWARWNAMSPREQASEAIVHSALLVEAFEALTAEQRESLAVKLPFLSFPLPIAGVAGMRLNELALHTWDVEVAFDSTAVVNAEAASALAEQTAGHLAFMLGFTGKPAGLSGRVVTLDVPSSGFVLEIGEAVSVVPASPATTATLAASPETALRLLSGRFRDTDTATVTGNVTLDELRQVFPGF